MNKLIILFLIMCLSGCVTTIKNKSLYNELANKDTKEILNIIPDHDVAFIGEPPCILSQIIILSREKKVLVNLRYNKLPSDLLERIPRCSWDIEEFYEYTPSKIDIENIDDDYIRRSNIKH